MSITMVLTQQTIIMFVFIACGYVLFKGGKITKKGSRDFANTLLNLVVPAVVLNSFCTSYTKEKMLGVAISLALAVLTLAMSIIVSRLFFKKNPVENFGSAFSNAGFIGIPLVAAALGKDAVIYVAGFTALLNVLQCTYGVFTLTGDKSKISVKAITSNPIVISAVMGVMLFSLGLGDKAPSIAISILSSLSALNAPMAMMILGTYLAQFPLKTVLTTLSLYKVSVVRLVIIPLLTVATVAFLPIDHTIKSAIVIVASAPVGANVAVYSQINNLDYKYACKCVALSTILSGVSLPLIYALFSGIG